MTRQEIHAAIESKSEAIKQIKEEINELYKQSLLLSDEKQWFEEKIERVSYRENRKKVYKDVLIGRINWIEKFKDEDTGDLIAINRSRVVRVDGKWDW